MSDDEIIMAYRQTLLDRFVSFLDDKFIIQISEKDAKKLFLEFMVNKKVKLN